MSWLFWPFLCVHQKENHIPRTNIGKPPWYKSFYRQSHLVSLKFPKRFSGGGARRIHWARCWVGMPEKWSRTAAVLTAALTLVVLTASLGGGRGPETASRNLPAVLPEDAADGTFSPLPALPALPSLASPDPGPASGGLRDVKEVGALLHDVAAIRKALLSLQSRELSREHSALKAGAASPSADPTTEAAAAEQEPTSVQVSLPAPALSPPASPEKGHERGDEARPRQTNEQRQRQPLQKQPQRTAQRGADEPGPKSAGFVFGLASQQRLADSEPLARRTLDLKGTAPYWASALDAGPERSRLEAGTDRFSSLDTQISSMLPSCSPKP